ncbi:hypothetical protein BV20DRAFT_671600 [Pilatotrama ljubarskyi]|nr:hypothetical protein BV20DRAFT_671600 [Pilatotrama ljubarskyi]
MAASSNTDDLSPSFPAIRVPDEDTVALRVLSLGEIDTWILGRATLQPPTRGESYACGLWSLRNMAIPLHRLLPVEILMRIFAHFRPSESRIAISLMHVCRHWRAIIIAMSEFWADMLRVSMVYRDGRLLETILFRSASQLFGVKYPHRRGGGAISSEVMAPHLHRISHLELSTVDEKPIDLYPLLKDGHFSSLQRLCIVGSTRDQLPASALGSSDHCADIALPRLRHLEIVSAWTFLPRLTVGSLEKLHLEAGEWDS